MFKIQFKAPKLLFDQKRFSRTLRDTLQAQLRNAAREFVRAAIVRIPIDTGEARGTFLPIGRFLHISVPISGAEPTVKKSEFTGESPEKRLIFQFSSNQYGEYFEIDWQLFHFWFNDFFQHSYINGQEPTPWGSIEAGKDAFLLYMKNEAPKRLPKIKDFILTSMLEIEEAI